MDSSTQSAVPLCVDLDGTLLRSDLLHESFLMLLREQPFVALRAPLWLLQGKAHLKAEIARRVDFSNASLPFNEAVVAHVRKARNEQPTVLVTGSHQSLADAVARQADLFDTVQGSDDNTNLTSHNKLDWLVGEYGEGGFDYIGNDEDDLAVWPAARQAMVVAPVNDDQQVNSKLAAGTSFAHVFAIDRPGLSDYLGLLRIHQWSKNLLVLVPLALDQRMADPAATITALMAFFAMCLLASATYIVNDMLDLQADRHNPTKSQRAMASGRVTLATGFRVMILLLLGVLALAVFLPGPFNAMLLLYLVLTLFYSFVLKRKAILDVITLAALHTLRVIAGAVAIYAEQSFWLLAFSMFLFFSLALAKRVAELENLEKAGKEEANGRDYRVSDRPLLMSMGVAAANMSVLVIALYINSDEVRDSYANPTMLWLTCPILMYWLTRIWMKTSRGLMHEDPIVFAMRDTISLVSVGLMGAVLLLAITL
ncbi:MAG: UbiA family prenyltransferase [Granulosicoccus sp.]